MGSVAFADACEFLGIIYITKHRTEDIDIEDNVILAVYGRNRVCNLGMAYQEK